ncbi:MAG: CBS domain-containing protein [Bacteroidota bacterium]
MNVQTILKNKTKPLITISENETVYQALKIMGEYNIGALLIIENDQLTGIISERDYARKIALKGKNSHETTVGDIMTRDLFTITMKDSIETCMGLMRDKHIRHLPVLENNKVVGMVSIGDVVNSVIESQKATINHLSDYIRNS